jgi:hypothetical protein
MRRKSPTASRAAAPSPRWGPFSLRLASFSHRFGDVEYSARSKFNASNGDLVSVLLRSVLDSPEALELPRTDYVQYRDNFARER